MGVTPGMSIVIPICGIRRCLSHYVRSLLGRALGRVRVVLISSRSPSGYPRVYSECTRRSSHVGVVRGGGRKLKVTHGDNVRVTSNRCIAFYSSSSFIRSRACTYMCGYYGSRSLSVYYFRRRHMARRNVVLPGGRGMARRFFRKTGIGGFLVKVVNGSTVGGRDGACNVDSYVTIFHEDVCVSDKMHCPDRQLVTSRSLIFLLCFLPRIRGVGVLPGVFCGCAVGPSSVSRGCSTRGRAQLVGLLRRMGGCYSRGFRCGSCGGRCFARLLHVFGVVLGRVSLDGRSFVRGVIRLDDRAGRPLLRPFCRSPVSRGCK